MTTPTDDSDPDSDSDEPVVSDGDSHGESESSDQVTPTAEELWFDGEQDNETTGNHQDASPSEHSVSADPPGPAPPNGSDESTDDGTRGDGSPGEPFEELADRTSHSQSTGVPPRTGDDQEQSSADSNPEAAASTPDRAEPMGELAERIDGPRTDPGTESGLFTEEEVSEIDPEAVWDQLDEETALQPHSDPSGASGERVIETGSYCERCEYFSAPPAVHCTNEGTEILELVDVDQFRVRGCPKVEEEERLEQL